MNEVDMLALRYAHSRHSKYRAAGLPIPADLEALERAYQRLCKQRRRARRAAASSLLVRIRREESLRAQARARQRQGAAA